MGRTEAFCVGVFAAVAAYWLLPVNYWSGYRAGVIDAARKRAEAVLVEQPDGTWRWRVRPVPATPARPAPSSELWWRWRVRPVPATPKDAEGEGAADER